MLVGVFSASIAFAQNFTTSNLKPGESSGNLAGPTDADYFITHSLSQSVVSLASVSCNAGGLHADNSYLRVFDLPGQFGINEPINISAVEFGIESANGASGSQPVVVNIYTLAGPLQFSNLNLIASEPAVVPDQTLTLFNVPVSAIIPAGSVLVVEIFTPDGQTAGNSFFIGSNNLGQTAPTYIAAAECGIPEIMDLVTVGFPNMHTVLNVYASSAEGSEIPISNWALILGLLLISGFVIYRMRS